MLGGRGRRGGGGGGLHSVVRLVTSQTCSGIKQMLVSCSTTQLRLLRQLATFMLVFLRWDAHAWGD